MRPIHLPLPRAASIRLFLLAVSTLAASAAARQYRSLKGESSISYHLKHPMHDVTGVSREPEIVVDLAPDTVSSRISVSVDARTFDSGNSNRDSHALELIRARKHPKILFVSDAVKPDGTGYLVSGNLTFAGRTRPLSFKVTPVYHKDKVEIKGAFTIKLSDYDVKRPSLMFVPSEDKLKVSIDVFAKLQPGDQ